jgi:hypothetical protein
MERIHIVFNNHMASAAASSAASIKGDDVTSTFTEDPSARRAEMLSLPSSGALSMDSEATSEEPSDRLQRMADACRTLLVVSARGARARETARRGAGTSVWSYIFSML